MKIFARILALSACALVLLPSLFVPFVSAAPSVVPDAVAVTSSSTTDGSTDAVTTPVSGGVEGDKPAGPEGFYERAVVEDVALRSKVINGGAQQIEVYMVRFLSGSFNGQTKEVSSDVGSNPYGLQPRKGDKVVIFQQPAPDGGTNFYMESFDRRGAMFWLVVLFAFTLVLLAGWQGAKVVFSIGLSIGLIVYVLIPSFIRGVNPVPLAIALGGLFTLISSGLTIGWNKKTYVTAIGTIGGGIVAYLVSVLFANWSHLNGLSTEEDRMFFEKNPTLNAKGLLFAGIIIASIGVVEDVAVSIASGVSEVKRANPRSSFRDLFVSGMAIGNDHMGALANTLVYAYVGGSLSTLLLYQQFGGSWLKFMNFDAVVDEVIRSLAGTIGLVFTVPITALLSAWAMQKRNILHEPGHEHEHGEHAHAKE